MDRRQLAIAGSVGLLALLLRGLAARGDLWLDEIWSLENVRPLASPLQVFTSIHSDNNHYLTSLYLTLLGDRAPCIAYRLPSVLAGAFVTVMATLPPFSHRPREALVAGLLIATSPLLVQYDSEARGYALAVFFTLAAYRLFDRFVTSGGWGPALGFGALAGLGLLAHLTFLFALIGFAAWAATLMYRRWRLDPRLLAGFSIPGAVFILLWLVDLRVLVSGGARAFPFSVILQELASSLVGLPVPLALAVLTLGVIAAGLEGEQPAPETPWVFFVTTIVAGPALVLLITRPDSVAPRHFLMGAPFALILLAQALVRLAEMGRFGWRLAASAIALVVGGGLLQDAALIRLGRGGYAAAVAYMSAHTDDPTMLIGSDHDFRNVKVLAWYAGRVPNVKPIRYESQPDWADHPPEWIVVHEPLDGRTPEVVQFARGGRHYHLEQHFPHAGLSGTDWWLYRRMER